MHTMYLCFPTSLDPEAIRVSHMDYSSKILDHHGIVAGVCREIELVDTVNRIVGVNHQQKVSTGDAVMAMVINALGFVSKPLYMFPDFMETKPVDRLFENSLLSEDFNDDTLGRALDRLYENDNTKIFMEVSTRTLSKLGVEKNFFHLDTTSMSVHGEYEHSDEEMVPIEIVKGHSKDGNFDLKQYLISLITVSESDLPVWIDTLSGNTSDKTHFREVIQQYSRALAEGDDVAYFVMDSAMYTDKNVRELSNLVKWLTRVPESIGIAKDLLAETDENDMAISGIEGYRLNSVLKTYGDIEQKWVVVFSEDAYAREMKTFRKNIEKEKQKIKKQLWHFKNDEFKCEADAIKALNQLERKWKYFKVDEYDVNKKNKTGKRGRPKKGSNACKNVFLINANFKEDDNAIEAGRLRKGKFILATNDIDLDQEVILREYKQQQSVERGFRFIKDPMFFTNSTFLKKPQRIVSLVMVMGLSLLVYAIAQRKLRNALVEMNETVPDQLGKPTKTPTMRWIFQKFENISLLKVNDGGKVSQQVLNMKPIHEKILALMGEEYEKIYFLKRGCGK